MVRTILRLHQVTAATGYSRTRIYELMAEDRFPRAVKLGEQAIGWFEDEVEAWQEALPRVAAQQVSAARESE